MLQLERDLAWDPVPTTIIFASWNKLIVLQADGLTSQAAIAPGLEAFRSESLLWVARELAVHSILYLLVTPAGSRKPIPRCRTFCALVHAEGSVNCTADPQSTSCSPSPLTSPLGLGVPPRRRLHPRGRKS